MSEVRSADTITEVVAETLAQDNVLPKQGILVVAVSGGADSLCLLHILHRLCGPGQRMPGITLHVAHFNHQLRGAVSDHEAEEVEHIAHAWGLPFTRGTAPVRTLAAQEHRSLEDAARVARYQFLRSVAQGGPIAVAHHRDDQVETLLLHWLRGEGPSGMVGLQTRQQDIIRPLLTITRAETHAYCVHYGLQPMEDASNADIHYQRNRIRHQLLPLLEEMNPGFRATLLRNAEVAHIDYAWLQSEVDRVWPQIVLDSTPTQIRLAQPGLQRLPLSLRHHLLRRASALLCAGQSPLELRHYQLLDSYIDSDSKQASPSSAWRAKTLHLPGNLHAILQSDILVINSISEQEQAMQKTEASSAFQTGKAVHLTIPGSVDVPGTHWRASAAWVTEGTCQQLRAALQRRDKAQLKALLPETAYSVYIDAATLTPSGERGDPVETLYVRTRRAGDRMQPLGMNREKKIKDIFIDRHVPPDERAQTPLFFSARHCLWLGGIYLDQRARLTENTKDYIRLSLAPISRQNEKEKPLYLHNDADLHHTAYLQMDVERTIEQAETNEGHMHPDIEEILISAEQIRERTLELGRQITEDYRGKNLLLLGTLKGAVPFIADLARCIDLTLEIDYMAISSYGNTTHSSGIVRIMKDLEGPIDQKHVLIIEDIIDSGLTLRYLVDLLQRRNPLSVKVCTLLNKDRESAKNIKVDYPGFVIPDKFVVGYGLDYAQHYRNLPYVGILKPAIYSNVAVPEEEHKSPAEQD